MPQTSFFAVFLCSNLCANVTERFEEKASRTEAENKNLELVFFPNSDQKGDMPNPGILEARGAC